MNMHVVLSAAAVTTKHIIKNKAAVILQSNSIKYDQVRIKFIDL